MSGSRRSIRITSGRCSLGERDPLGAGLRLQRPEAGGRSTSRASFRFFSLSSTIRTSGPVPAGPGVTAYPLAMAIRLVLAEDHYLVREGVRRLLETRPDLEVAAVCGDLDSLLAAVDAERPDVVVTDIRMPPGGTDEGIQAAERLREIASGGRCRRPQPVREPELRARAPGGRQRPARVSPEGARDGHRATRSRDPRRRRRGLGDRPEGGRRARGGEGARRRVAAQPADAARARRAARDGGGEEQRGDRRRRSS